MHADDRPPAPRVDGSAVRTGSDIARLLRDLRRREARQRGDSPLTCREMAASTGWSRSLIARYLNGQALPPSDRFDVLVQLLGATPAELGALATARDRVEEDDRCDISDPGRPGGPWPRLECQPGIFAGRAAELRLLDGALQMAAAYPAGANIVVIEGAAGVGKTALALHWAHLVADRFPDGRLYVDLQGFHPERPPVTGADAVRSLLDALRVPADRVPDSCDAQAALYRTRLAGKRMLVVLDNARDAGQVRPLLPGTPECLVVVTSRNQLTGLVAIEGARPLPLEPLSVGAPAEPLP
jgi:transcriptional regulator with XRE-family HTH domain